MLKENILIKIILILLFNFASNITNAQLDTIHYMPPMHSSDPTQVTDHYMYLSTPEAIPFVVTIKDGGGAILATPTISNGSPFRYTIAANDPSKVLVSVGSLNTVLPNLGLILTAPSEFYANFRVRSANQGGVLTCKDQAAKCTTFRAFTLPHTVTLNQLYRFFFTGVMATEDNTTVTISDYDTGVEFRTSTGTITDDTLTFTLNAGESYVISGLDMGTPANYSSLSGTLIRSDKLIVL